MNNDKIRLFKYPDAVIEAMVLNSIFSYWVELLPGNYYAMVIKEF